MVKSKKRRVCSRCGRANDSKSGARCKRCHARYQQERGRINAGTQCAAPRCKGKRTATSAYCKVCRSKREKKYWRARLAKMTPKELAKFRRKRAEYRRKHAAEMTPKERAEQSRKRRERQQARRAKMSPKALAKENRKDAELIGDARGQYDES